MCRIYNILLLFTVILGANSITTATVKNWNNASGGSWFTPGNWTPAGVPGSSDTASIILNGTYTVTIDSYDVSIRRLDLGGSSGIQTLQIDAPASELALTRPSIIHSHGRLNVGQNTLSVGDWGHIEGPDTLWNSGTISLDSGGEIELVGQNCDLLNQPGGSILFNGRTFVSAMNFMGWWGSVENSGSIIKSGPDTLELGCGYGQESGGTFSLESGWLRIYAFWTEGLVTLASGTEIVFGEVGAPPPGPILGIDSGGVVEMQGTARISPYGLARIMNGGELRHTLAGTSVLAMPYDQLNCGTWGYLGVLAGKLSLDADWHNLAGLISVPPSGELEVWDGYFCSNSTVTSSVADSGILTLTGDGINTEVYSDTFSFSGALRVLGDSITFSPVTDPVTLHSYTIDSGAYFAASVTIQTDSVRMNGGTTDADMVVTNYYDWKAGELAGSSGSAITIAPGISLSVSGPSAKQLSTRDMMVDGTAQMSGSGELTVTGGAAIVVESGGTLTIGDSLTITGVGDTLFNYGAMTLNCPLDTSRLNLYVYNGPTAGRTPGTIDIPSGRVECNGGVGNDGTIIVGAAAELYLGEPGSNSGSLEITDGALCTVDDTLLNLSSGTINLYGDGDIGGDGILMNEGHVNRNGSGLLTVTNSLLTTRFESSATGFLTINADTLTLTGGGSNAGDINIQLNCVLRIFGTFTNLPGGVIHGGGVLDVSNAVFTNEGTINPGSSPGTLAIVGNIVSSGIINIELAGLIPGTQYDRLLVSGSAVLGGTLNFSRLNGFIPTLTDSFHFLTYSGCTGEFAAVTGTPVGNGTYMEIAYGATGIVQYVCNGISDIAVSVASISDTIPNRWEDTLGLDICNEGYCPLEWTTEFTPFSPGYPDSCPTWEGVGSGGWGLLTRLQCLPLRVAVSALCPARAYNSEIRISSNDPDEPLTVIPVQVIVSGAFAIGGPQADFLNFSAAVQFLIDEGVVVPTLFNVHPGDYEELVTIPEIAGASAVNTITFRCETETARIRCNNAPALILNSANHLVFERIGFENYGTGGTNPYAVWLTNGADSNIIRDATVVGVSLTNSSSIGIYVDGAGNDGNVLESDTVVNSYYAVRLGSGSTTCTGNEVRNCLIPECRYGIYLYRQIARIHDNDIQPGFASATAPVSGVEFSSNAVGDTAWICNNRIHNFRSTQGVGVMVPSAAGGVIHILNNCIYDWQNTGTVIGIAVGGASRVECQFNSIRINDVPTSGSIVAVLVSYESAQVTLSNNVLEVDEPTSSCYSIYFVMGYLSSNYNCFYGTGSQYYVGRNFLGQYATLPAWRTATGHDMQSRQGDPHFLGATNLHIDPFASFVDSAGVTVAGVATDMDGDLRAGVPDIGADEYTVSHDRVDDLVIRRNALASGVDLIWSAVPGANSYRIYQSDPSDSSSVPTILLATTGNTSYTHAGTLLPSGATRLCYHVTASTASP